MAEVETKHDKFKRLATQRVTNALKKIELIKEGKSVNLEPIVVKEDNAPFIRPELNNLAEVSFK